MVKGEHIKLTISILSITLFLFIQNPLLKLGITFLYILGFKLFGQKVRLIPNIFLIISIIVINVLSPEGRVLYTFGQFNLTVEALLGGIDKSALLVGLIYLSKILTKEPITIPGYFGELLSKTFFYFNQLTSGDKVNIKTFIRDIDKKLYELDHNYKESFVSNNKIDPLQIAVSITTLLTFILDNFLDNF